MVDFRVSNQLTIKSYKGKYNASFIRGGMDQLNKDPDENVVYIIDKNITKLYRDRLSNILNSQRVLKIEATEENKSLDCFPAYVDALIELKIRRDQTLVAIGGGIIQDITCFLAATLMRGISWEFYPTTLLAQSDSCIGSKSSINSGDVKNILGTFTPPNKIIIDVDFLTTLEEKDIFSGIGEMIKVHAINSPTDFDSISNNYEKILTSPSVMESFIYKSLIMKKSLIEVDEFDQGPRNVMNYGHSFGHAIESVTKYKIPHGIAVTIGMDVANYVASKLGISTIEHFKRMHKVLEQNYKTFKHVNIKVESLMEALSKDKKNSATHLRLIFPDQKGLIGVGFYDNNNLLLEAINDYFIQYRMEQ
jgi:3-dehydroquinate synthase